MTTQERQMEAAKLRLRFQMNGRLRLESLAALSKVFRENGEPIREELLGSMVFAVPEELLGPADPNAQAQLWDTAKLSVAPATPGNPPTGGAPATPGKPPTGGAPATPGNKPPLGAGHTVANHRRAAPPPHRAISRRWLRRRRDKPPLGGAPATPGGKPPAGHAPATPGKPPARPKDRR